MECENSIKSIINNDNDIDNKYKIETKLLNRIKYRCSCDEPGDLPNYKHQNLKLSFDFSNSRLLNIRFFPNPRFFEQGLKKL